MREYKSIVVASSSSGNDNDDGMSIYNDFDGGDDFDGIRTKESTAATHAPPTRSQARSPILPTDMMTATTTTTTRTENPATSTAATG
jgi:hypothetical protein